MKTLPRREGPGLLPRLAQCLEDEQPVSLDDFPYFNEMLGEVRRYDIRANRAGADLLAMTWGDVTERFRYVERIAESEERVPTARRECRRRRLSPERRHDLLGLQFPSSTFLGAPPATGSAGRRPTSFSGRIRPAIGNALTSWPTEGPSSGALGWWSPTGPNTGFICMSSRLSIPKATPTVR